MLTYSHGYPQYALLEHSILNMVCYADDIPLTVDTEHDHQILLYNFHPSPNLEISKTWLPTLK